MTQGKPFAENELGSVLNNVEGKSKFCIFGYGMYNGILRCRNGISAYC